MASFFLYVYSGDFFLCVYIGIFPGGGGAQVVGSVTFFPLCLQSECFFQVCVCVWPVCVWGGQLLSLCIYNWHFFQVGGAPGPVTFFLCIYSWDFCPGGGSPGVLFSSVRQDPPPGAEPKVPLCPMSYVQAGSRAEPEKIWT